MNAYSNKNAPGNASPNSPPKNPDENDVEMAPVAPQQLLENIPDGDVEAKHDPNPLEFPAPGTLLGRIVGGTPGALRVKLIPSDPGKPPIHTYYITQNPSTH